jgi:Protein of unknown function DUF82.
VKVLLDEHLSPLVARLLRDRGHDVLAVAERTDLVGLADTHLWVVATREHRAIVTENVRDYALLARATAAEGGRHGGLILVSPGTFWRTRNATGLLVEALHHLISDHPGDALWDRTVWLTSAEPDDSQVESTPPGPRDR